MPESSRPAQSLLASELKVVNVGLQEFAANLAARGVPVQQVDWSPARATKPALAALLQKLGT